MYLKLRNLEPGTRRETRHRKEGEKKEEMCIHLKILTSGIAEGAKKFQRSFFCLMPPLPGHMNLSIFVELLQSDS